MEDQGQYQQDANLSCGTFDEDYYHKIMTCSFWVEGILMVILGAFALVVNAISIYAFTRKEMRNSFNYLIVVLTVVDSIFCIFLVADYSFARAFNLHTVLYTMLYPYFIYPMTNVMLSASIFLTVVLGLERYIAVCFPLLHRDLAYTYSVSKRVWAYTGPVMVVSILINIPKFLETQIVVETKSTLVNESDMSQPSWVNVTTYTMDVTDLRNNPIYIKFYMNIARTVLLGIIPFLALIFFNVKIYLRILQTRGRYSRNNNNSSQAYKDLQLAMMLVCVVCMFFVTNLPRLLLNLYELFIVDEMIRCESFWPPVWFMCMTSVNHFLLIVNTIGNFLVYCCFNKGFKRVILRMLGRKIDSRNVSQLQNSQIGATAAGGGPGAPPPSRMISSPPNHHVVCSDLKQKVMSEHDKKLPKQQQLNGDCTQEVKGEKVLTTSL